MPVAGQAAAVLQELMDRAEIVQLLHLYCRAVDRRDAGLLATLYHPDAYEDHLVYRGPAAGFIEVIIEQLASDTFGMHDLGTSIIELDDDVARAETYYTSYRGRLRAGGGEYLIRSGGRYFDRLERRSGGPWLIASRSVTREWRYVDRIEPEWLGQLQRTA
jgi:hypothetical protein